MVSTINQSFTEVYDIVKHLDSKLYNKIPNQFIEMLKQNMDTNYNVNIDYSKNINEQELLQDTRIILSLIYRDYICSIEKRQELIEKDKLELKKHQEELKEKYEVERIFESRKQEQTTKKTQLVEYKETFFRKILNKIIKFFVRN